MDGGVRSMREVERESERIEEREYCRCELMHK